MENEGLVVRRNDPADQRAILVSLTEKGHEMDRLVIEAIRQNEHEMMCNITSEELALVRPILEKMYRNLAGEEGQN